MTSPCFGDSRVLLGFSFAVRLRDSPSYPPALSRNLVRSESNQEALRWLSSRGGNRSRRSHEQSEPTEPRPATGRPGQAGPTAGRRRPAEARPATAGARKGRTAGRSGRTAPGRTRAKPLNDLRQFGPGFGRGAADRIICWRRIKISASRRTLDLNSLSFLRSMTSRAHSGVGCEWFGFHDARHGDGTL